MNHKSFLLFLFLAVAGFVIVTGSSCYTPKWVAQPAKVTTYGGKIKIEVIGKPVGIGDTTINCMIIRKQ